MRLDFSRLSSVKIGGVIDVRVLKDDFSSLDHFIIGSASNILMSDTPPNLAILDEIYNYIELDEVLCVGGKTPARSLYAFAKKHDIGGFEFLGALPGVMGGLLKMNAGLKESNIFERLIDIKTHEGVFEKKDIKHGYRSCELGGVFLQGCFEVVAGFSKEKDAYFRSLRSNQPRQPSFGSAFKNPKGDYAARLIDACGVKGTVKGGAQISPVHANFFINFNKASFEDMIYLLDLAQNKVAQKFNINLEKEVIVL